MLKININKLRDGHREIVIWNVLFRGDDRNCCYHKGKSDKIEINRDLKWQKIKINQ